LNSTFLSRQALKRTLLHNFPPPSLADDLGSTDIKPLSIEWPLRINLPSANIQSLHKVANGPVLK